MQEIGDIARRNRRAQAVEFSNRLLASLCFHHPDHCPEAAVALQEKAKSARSAFTSIEVERTQAQKAAEWVERRKKITIPVEMPIVDVWREPTVRAIQTRVCECFGLELIDLLSHRRTKDIVWPRQIAMYLAKKLTTNSLPEIGRRFGYRDHTTVLHAIKKIASRVERDSEVAVQVEAIRQSLTEEKSWD